MYKQFLGVITICCTTQAYSNCKVDVNPVNLTAVMTNALADNNYQQLSAQTVNASSAQPISECAANISSTFSMADTNLLTTSTIIKDGRTYYKIPSNYISPTPTFDVYMAFSVKDNKASDLEKWVDNATSSYILYSGSGAATTRGIRVENVRLLVTGLGNSAGKFTINNLKLGSMSASTVSTNIFFSSLTFDFKTTTCRVNNGGPINVTLPTVRTTNFTAVNQTLGDTSFTISITDCGTGDKDKSLWAILTDNNSTESNDLGLLTNAGNDNSQNVAVQITNDSGIPLSIAPKLISNSAKFFSFGTISSTGSVEKVFKARYYAKVIPILATNVSAQATITLIYN